jgi:protein-S-isoprenylcysteine O-methyltransferase Ste14
VQDERRISDQADLGEKEEYTEYNEKMLNTGFLWILLAVGLYGLLHSLLASMQAKELAIRWFGEAGERYYRLIYVIVVSLTFLPVFALILLLPDRTLYTIPFPWLLLTLFIQLLSGLGILLAFKDISVGNFLGTDQVLDPDSAGSLPPLVVKGVFRFSRHPLYLFSILILWLTPVMSWNILAFNIGATLYMLIGTIPEERKLLAQFGETYAQYRRCTAWLIPGLKLKRESCE